MNNTLLKSILAGLLLGATMFVLPFFLLRIAVFVLLIGALFRLFGGNRLRRGGWGRRLGPTPAFADRIRQMNDEEYTAFKQRFGEGRCGDTTEGSNSCGAGQAWRVVGSKVAE